MNANIDGREAGRKWREVLFKELEKDPEWGQLNLTPSGRIVTKIGSRPNKKIVVRYSKLHYGKKWWYDIIKTDWKNWDDNTYLVLLLADGNRCRFALLSPSEATELLTKIIPTESKEAKIIHVIQDPGSSKSPFIRQWEDFSFKSRVHHLSPHEA